MAGRGEVGVAGKEDPHLHSGKYDPLLHVNVVMSAAVKRVMGQLAGGRGCCLAVTRGLHTTAPPSLPPRSAAIPHEVASSCLLAGALSKALCCIPPPPQLPGFEVQF